MDNYGVKRFGEAVQLELRVVLVVWLNTVARNQATPQSVAPPTDASPQPVRHLTKTTQAVQLAELHVCIAEREREL